MRLRTLLLLLSWLIPATGGAVVVSGGDGAGNTTAPPDDPGFVNVGSAAGLTAVYLGGGWVLTANHVGTADPLFDGVSYAVVPGSSVQLHNDDGSLADLRVFRVNPLPPLPSLAIFPAAPPVAASLVVVGRGLDRGAATSWSGHAGWLLASTARIRWGTNRVSAKGLDVLGTHAFQMDFTQSGGTSYESQAVVGDSGGAAFLKSGSTWYLAGILFANSVYFGQPSNTVLFGNLSYAAQLSDYASEVSGLVGQPVCADGLDNDGDGKVDYSADPGCRDAGYMTESPACSNGVDDDGDGYTDLLDPQCGGRAWFPLESSAVICGLGFELVLVLPPLAWWRARRRKI